MSEYVPNLSDLIQEAFWQRKTNKEILVSKLTELHKAISSALVALEKDEGPNSIENGGMIQTSTQILTYYLQWKKASQMHYLFTKLHSQEDQPEASDRELTPAEQTQLKEIFVKKTKPE